MNKHPIRVGILGAARIAPSAMVVPASRRDDVEVRCIAARDPARAREFASKHEIPQVEKDYAAVIARDDLDLIYVPLPPAMHAEWTIRALESGKAVLCEKPFALSAAEARDMVRAAERSGKPLMEALHYRFHAVMLKAISLVRGGALGRLLRAQAVFEAQVPPEDTLWRGDLGCGALTDLGCYPIHALRTLLGEPEVVAASARVERGAFAEVDAHLSFAGGVIGRMRASMISPGRQWWLRIEGERGHMEISNFIVPHLFSCELSTQIDGVPAVEQPVGATTYEAQLDHVVDVLARGVPMLTGGADAIANMAVIDAIRAAAGSGGQPMAGLIPTGR